MRTITTTGSVARPTSVETTLTDAEALQVLGRCTSNFAQDLVAKHKDYLAGRLRYPLSGNQMVWVHKLAMEQTARETRAAAPTAPAQPALDFGKVRELFDKAGSSRKYPKMRFAQGGLILVLSRAGERSRTPGALNITDERKYPENSWYGRVNLDGTFTAGRDLTPAVLAFLERLAADPVAVAKDYGHSTGECCFCGKELTVASQAWGPDCARAWGLPYDSLTKRAARERRAARQAPAAEAPDAADEGGDGPGDSVLLGASFPDHDLLH